MNNTINSVYLFDELLKTMTVEALLDGITKISYKLENENDRLNADFVQNEKKYTKIDNNIYSLQTLSRVLHDEFKV